jgi:cell fate regulator YaaT (PSP1 superfamily)
LIIIKYLFYFTSDGRVDFRELVKDLASVFKTRIELQTDRGT